MCHTQLFPAGTADTPSLTSSGNSDPVDSELEYAYRKHHPCFLLLPTKLATIPFSYCQHQSKVNLWLWQFGRGKQGKLQLGGLSVADREDSPIELLKDCHRCAVDKSKYSKECKVAK